MEIEQKSFIREIFTNADLGKYSFTDCRFEACIFRAANLRQSRILNCEFNACDLSTISVEAGRISDSKFVSCKMLGIDFSKLDRLIFSASFEDCMLGKSSFYGLTLKKFSFRHCQLVDVDFSNCDLAEADLSFSDCQGAIFHHTNLSKANLATAKNYRINPLNNRVLGAKVSLSEGSSFLLELGLKIV